MQVHTGHRARLKKRFLDEGLESFQPHEVLELLCYYAIPQGDTNPLAHTLLNACHGNFADVLDADFHTLLEVDGVGEHTATLLKLIPAVSNYYRAARYAERPFLQSCSDAGTYAAAQIGDRIDEVFALIMLNAQRRVIAFDVISVGTVGSAHVSPRKAAQAALRHHAHSVIMVHNHPSGSLTPSEEDRILTDRLCRMYDAMEIPVLDHLIVAGTSFVSFSERGLMPN